ncbi:MAG: aspartate/glutamate racemase family protein, partial [Nitrospirota bacterium]
MAESRQDLAIMLPDVIEAIVEAEKKGYDAVFSACLTDSGIAEGRELVNIPVLGSLKVSMHVYAMLGHRFTILMPNEYIGKYIQETIHKYGFEGRGSVRALKRSMTAEDAVSAFLQYKRGGKSPGFIIDDLVSECVDAIREDDAEVLGMGCGTLVWAADMVSDELRKRGYDIPVLNPYS